MLSKPLLIIVDDHLTFRQGLKTILTVENIATVIGEASNGEEFIELLSHLKPDLVLMDIDMPQMNGIEATEKAVGLIPGIKIIAYTMYGDDEHYYKMIDLGVRGFMLKSSGIDELEKTINEVMMGKYYFASRPLKNLKNTHGERREHSSEIIECIDKELAFRPNALNIS